MRKHKFMRKLICITHAAHRLYISCALIHSLVHELKCLVLNVIFHLLTNHLFFSQTNNFFCYPVKKGIHLFHMSIICLISTIHPPITHKITFPFLICFRSEIFQQSAMPLFRILRILQLQHLSYCSCIFLPFLFLSVQFFSPFFCNPIEAALSR